MPHFHVVAEVLDLLGQRQHKQVADLAEVRRVSGLLLEILEKLDREALEARVGLNRELLPNAACAPAGPLRTQRLALAPRSAAAHPTHPPSDGTPHATPRPHCVPP